MEKIKLGIIREEKTPPDFRTPLTPIQCRQLLDQHPGIEVYVQSSNHRCFSDAEYALKGIPVVEDISIADALIGIKEVPVNKLIPCKTYFFFSHTAKKQPYNRELLRQMIRRHIRMIDYEYLTKDLDGHRQRVLGFGYFAGIVGAHNGLITWGKRTQQFQLKPAYLCKDYAEMKKQYKELRLPPIRIILTGTGRVASGALEILKQANVKKVSPKELLEKEFDIPVFSQLTSPDLYERKSDKGYNRIEFHTFPEDYQSKFLPYTKITDLMINAVFWNPKAPKFFNKEDMKSKDFKIKVIADITCDINGSIPATLKATTIQDPVFGYNPITQSMEKPYQPDTIDVMSVDNLPNELPRDASEKFGIKLMKYVIEKLIESGKSNLLERATICNEGKLAPAFEYLNDFVSETVN